MYIAGVIERDNLVFKCVVNRLGIHLVLITLVLVGTFLLDSPSSIGTVTLSPPTVKHGEVQDTVHHRLLATGARGLQRTCRGVEPHIHTTGQSAAEFHVVVADKQNLTNKLRLARDVDNHLDEVLAGLIIGMCLTGKEEDDGTFRVVDQLRQTLQVAKQQMGALVGGETTGEADNQGVLIQIVDSLQNQFRAFLTLAHVFLDLLREVGYQLMLQLLADGPDGIVRHLFDLLPHLHIRLMVEVIRTKSEFVKTLPEAVAPSR